ncbi:MAG: hypothetical protein IT257_11720 [Chitinophagaceae bacterium]|nr:hypothetical protein [Chitinophagaceae bacterium]
MQKDDHLLDQYLKNKVEDAIFDFKEEYWLKASQMLDEEDKKKKRPFFWRWFAIICVVVGAGIGTFLISGKQNSKKEAGQMAQQKSTSAGNPAVESSANANNTKSYVTDPPLAQTTQPVEGNTPDASATPSAPKYPTPVMSAASGPDSDQPHNTKNRSHNASAAANGALATAKTEMSPADNKAQNKAAQQNENPVQPQATESGQSVQPKRNRPGRKAVAIAAQKEKQASEKQSPDGQAKNDTKKNILLHGKTMTPKDTQTYAVRRPLDPAVSNPRYRASLSDYVADRISDSVIVYNFTPVAASPSGSSDDTGKKDSQTVHKKGIQFYLSGGASLNKGFKGNMGTTVSAGIAPYLNVGAEKQLSSKITLAAQIGFTYFNALNVQHKVVSYKYSFGFDSTSVAVEYRKLYQLMLPVSLAWQFSKNHQLWAAAGASYVMNTANRLNNNGNISHPTGYQEGINPFDLFAQLGYQYGLSRHIAIQAFLHQGFFSTTQKDFFNLSHSNSQTRVSLGLKYYFKRNGN